MFSEENTFMVTNDIYNDLRDNEGSNSLLTALGAPANAAKTCIAFPNDFTDRRTSRQYQTNPGPLETALAALTSPRASHVRAVDLSTTSSHCAHALIPALARARLTITHLKLSHILVGVANYEWQEFTQSLNTLPLTHLDLSRNWFDHKPHENEVAPIVTMMRALSQHPTLKSIDLSHCIFKDEAQLLEVIAILTSPPSNIEILHYENHRQELTPEGTQALAQALRAFQARRLFQRLMESVKTTINKKRLTFLALSLSVCLVIALVLWSVPGIVIGLVAACLTYLGLQKIDQTRTRRMQTAYVHDVQSDPAAPRDAQQTEAFNLGLQSALGWGPYFKSFRLAAQHHPLWYAAFAKAQITATPLGVAFDTQERAQAAAPITRPQA